MKQWLAEIRVIVGLTYFFALTVSGFSSSWETGAGFRTAALTVPSGGRTGFDQLRSPQTAILFTNLFSSERGITNQIYFNGSGVAAGDVDGDGWCDLYFCGLDGNNALYRNLGNWKFKEIANEAGVACANLDATAAAFADLDGDGDLDLIVNSVGGGVLVFGNDGKGHFTPIAQPAPLNERHGGMSMALADVDGDGDLDLYVTNYRTSTIRDHPNTRLRANMVDGKPVVISVNDRPVTEPDLVGRFALAENHKIVEFGEADALYLNDGKGGFTVVSFIDGSFLDEDGKPLTAPPYDWGLSVMFHDLNGDGWPDIYVCNDFNSPDRIWINDAQGRFRALARLALRNTSLYSMGIDFADVNRDGHADFFVADMLSRDHVKQHNQLGDIMAPLLRGGDVDDRPQYSRNTLQLSREDGTFAEIGQFAGLQASEWSWTPIFLDVDLDGYEDLIVTTGHERDAMNADISKRLEARKKEKQMTIREQLEMRRGFPRLDLPKVAFRNRGDLTFEEVSTTWGLSDKSVANGMCLADLDNDGDMDVVMNNLNGEAGVYRNEGSAPRVAVRLRGLPPNTQGIGSRIRVLGGAVPMQSQEVICGGRYLSGDDPERVFAAGNLAKEMTIEVSWRGGRQSVVKGVKANRIYEIEEAEAEEVQSAKFKVQSEQSSVVRGPWSVGKRDGRETKATDPGPRTTDGGQPLFEDVSQLLQHTHVEEPYEDFARQPLLPNRLSQLGPGVSWMDVDGDGQEDLLVGSGKGGNLGVYWNDGRGGFKRADQGIWTQRVTRDQTTILGLGSGQVLVGSANYEDGLAVGGAVKVYDAKRRVIEDGVEGGETSTGPMALADVDGDGDLDLFVGGRVLAGRYAESGTSRLWRNEGGKFVLQQKFEQVGLVSGAVFSDLDGDGRPELLLACEWGPIRILRSAQGKWSEWNPVVSGPALNPQPATLNSLTGWWNGVNTVDLDGDGRLDIIASNWGLNSKYRTSRGHPRKLYYGDMAGNGTVEVIEAYWDEGMKKEVPERGLKAVAAALPWVQEKWTSYEGYGKASVVDIYGEKLKSMGVREATTLASMAFLNRGDHLEAVAMPQEAQFAPAFGICVADVDGDGNEDVFLSQNFFAVNADNARCDAGRGLWLRGDGTGKLTAMSGQESGVKVYGEQRGAAVCDYDGDGRVDLVVGQNGAETKLYHNAGAKPGLRVRLAGPPGNPRAVGAKVRLVAGAKKGPMRELHAGSGYWSQDSAIPVMSLAEIPTHVWVQWPGGKTTTSELPMEAKEIEISPDGKSRALQ
jgi:hypothetical protein